MNSNASQSVNSFIGPDTALDAPRFLPGQKVRVACAWGACPGAVGVVRDFEGGMYLVAFIIPGARWGNAWTYFPRWLEAAS
jgi:hypothetical protein